MRRIASDHDIRFRNIFGYHCASADNTSSFYVDAGTDDGIRANPGPVSNDNILPYMVASIVIHKTKRIQCRRHDFCTRGYYYIVAQHDPWTRGIQHTGIILHDTLAYTDTLGSHDFGIPIDLETGATGSETSF